MAYDIFMCHPMFRFSVCYILIMWSMFIIYFVYTCSTSSARSLWLIASVNIAWKLLSSLCCTVNVLLQWIWGNVCWYHSKHFLYFVVTDEGSRQEDTFLS